MANNPELVNVGGGGVMLYIAFQLHTLKSDIRSDKQLQEKTFAFLRESIGSVTERLDKLEDVVFSMLGKDK